MSLILINYDDTTLPQNWTITTFDAILNYEQPTAYIVKSTEYSDTYKTAVLTAGKSFIIGYTNETKGIYSENLPVIIFDDFTSATQYVTFPFKVKSSAMKILQPINDQFNKKYIYYFMQTIKHNVTTHKRYWISDYSKRNILLPPLLEQHRIVAKIDSLFSELDNGVAFLKTIKTQLATYRQAVLKWAFEGKLTTEWRSSINHSNIVKELSENRIDNISYQVDGTSSRLNIPSDWLWISLGDIFPIEVGATPSRRVKEYWEGDINWVSSGEVKFCNIPNSREKITKLGLCNASTNLQPSGTVLLAMIGEGKTRGQAAIIKIPAAHNQNTAAIIVPNTIYPSEYIYYFLLYNYQNTRTVGSGNNQKALNKERVRKIPFPFTSKPEQLAIVSAIESRLSVCDKLEQTIDQTLALSASLRQSILKKAFEGRLVPQDPDDEPAEKLLERIKAEKAAVLAKQKRTRKRGRK